MMMSGQDLELSTTLVETFPRIKLTRGNVRHKFGVGDIVTLYNGNGEPFIGLLCKFGLDCHDNCFTEVQWFYRPSDIPAENRPKNCFKNEIFLADHKDMNLAESILETLRIEFRSAEYNESCVNRLYEDDWGKGTDSKIVPSYICRRGYDPVREEFWSLSSSDLRLLRNENIIRAPKSKTKKRRNPGQASTSLSDGKHHEASGNGSNNNGHEVASTLQGSLILTSSLISHEDSSIPSTTLLERIQGLGGNIGAQTEAKPLMVVDPTLEPLAQEIQETQSINTDEDETRNALRAASVATVELDDANSDAATPSQRNSAVRLCSSTITVKDELENRSSSVATVREDVSDTTLENAEVDRNTNERSSPKPSIPRWHLSTIVEKDESERRPKSVTTARGDVSSAPSEYSPSDRSSNEQAMNSAIPATQVLEEHGGSLDRGPPLILIKNVDDAANDANALTISVPSREDLQSKQTEADKKLADNGPRIAQNVAASPKANVVVNDNPTSPQSCLARTAEEIKEKASPFKPFVAQTRSSTPLQEDLHSSITTTIIASKSPTTSRLISPATARPKAPSKISAEDLEEFDFAAQTRLSARKKKMSRESPSSSLHGSPTDFQKKRSLEIEEQTVKTPKEQRSVALDGTEKFKHESKWGSQNGGKTLIEKIDVFPAMAQKSASKSASGKKRNPEDSAIVSAANSDSDQSRPGLSRGENAQKAVPEPSVNKQLFPNVAPVLVQGASIISLVDDDEENATKSPLQETKTDLSLPSDAQASKRRRLDETIDKASGRHLEYDGFGAEELICLDSAKLTRGDLVFTLASLENKNNPVSMFGHFLDRDDNGNLIVAAFDASWPRANDNAATFQTPSAELCKTVKRCYRFANDTTGFFSRGVISEEEVEDMWRRVVALLDQGKDVEDPVLHRFLGIAALPGANTLASCSRCNQRPVQVCGRFFACAQAVCEHCLANSTVFGQDNDQNTNQKEPRVFSRSRLVRGLLWTRLELRHGHNAHWICAACCQALARQVSGKVKQPSVGPKRPESGSSGPGAASLGEPPESAMANRPESGLEDNRPGSALCDPQPEPILHSAPNSMQARSVSESRSPLSVQIGQNDRREEPPMELRHTDLFLARLLRLHAQGSIGSEELLARYRERLGLAHAWRDLEAKRVLSILQGSDDNNDLF